MADEVDEMKVMCDDKEEISERGMMRRCLCVLSSHEDEDEE